MYGSAPLSGLKPDQGFLQERSVTVQHRIDFISSENIDVDNGGPIHAPTSSSSEAFI